MLGLALSALAERTGTTGRGLIEVNDVVLHATDAQRQTCAAAISGDLPGPLTSLNPTMQVGQVERSPVPKPKRSACSTPSACPSPGDAYAATPRVAGGLRQRDDRHGRGREPSPSSPTTDGRAGVTVRRRSELLAHLRDETGQLPHARSRRGGPIADRVSVLCEHIAEIGADDVSPSAHPYTRGLLRSRLTLQAPRDRPLPTLDGEPPDPRHHPPGCAFAPRCPHRVDECDESAPLMPVIPQHAGRAACFRVDAIDVDVDPTSRSWPEVQGTDECTALRVEGVHKRFPLHTGFRKRDSLHALRGVDLDVRAGESVALVGESGCGKSTLLRAIAGLMPRWREPRRAASSRGQRQRVSLKRATVVPPSVPCATNPRPLDVSLAATV